MLRYTPRYRDSETARRELRRDAFLFGVISVVSIALVVVGMVSDDSTKIFLIVRLAEVLMLIIVLPVTVVSLALSWLRWRKFR
ncbi:hypothetical protein [Actinomadura chokoriensis]|uniref:DUF3098 domain-containing protein n=1 Tax=Actinomadura chokoriensis TaxID=454156 RepID=A0ABV4R5C1_9ACTN